jgi:hypothetical protein
MGDCIDALSTRQQGGFRSHVALRFDLAPDPILLLGLCIGMYGR